MVPEEPAAGDLGEGEGQLQGHGARRAGAGRGRDHADRPGGQDPRRHVQGRGPGAARRDGHAGERRGRGRRRGHLLISDQLFHAAHQGRSFVLQRHHMAGHDRGTGIRCR